MSGDIEGILQVKINLMPTRPDLMARPRIVEQIEKSLALSRDAVSKLVLVSAPAGYGKSTMVREWAASHEKQSAWYSLDQRDNEYHRFWTYFISALQKVHHGLGRGTLEMLKASSFFPDTPADNEGLLTPLLNDLLYLDAPLYLILDDYHLVEEKRIHDGMIFLIENMPAQFCLVVATRTAPPWPLARWRAKGRVVEIRQDDLKFTPEESACYLARAVGQGLSQSDLGKLYGKTEGWITALQLAASSIRGAVDVGKYIKYIDGDHRAIFDFLTDEVFNRQLPSVQEFLLNTSVLPRFCPSLCDTVTGREDGRAVLDQLADENLFLVPLDEGGAWFRYHHLFADLLYSYLARRDSARIPVLHVKAAAWFLDSGDPGEAIRHALKGGDYPKGAQILHDYIDDLWEGEGLAQLLKWLNGLPEELIKKYPRLIAYQALICLTEGKLDEAGSCLELAAEMRYEEAGPQEEFTGMLAVARAMHASFNGDFTTGMQSAEIAMRLLTETNNFWRISAAIIYGDVITLTGDLMRAYDVFKDAYRWSRNWGNVFAAVTAGMNILKILWIKGDLPEARRFAGEMLQLAKETGLSKMPRVGVIWFMLGEVLREEGNLEEAERCSNRGAAICKPETLLAWVSYLFQLMVYFSRRDYKEAMKLLGQIESMERETSIPEAVFNLALSWKARILLEKGDVAAARDIMSQVDTDNMGMVYFPGNVQLVYSRLLLAGNRLGCARQVIDGVQSLPQYTQSLRLKINTLLIKANLEELSGAKWHAEKCLVEALSSGKSGGLYQVFFDEGKEVSPVLLRLIKGNKNSFVNEPGMGEYLRQICRGLLPQVSCQQQTVPPVDSDRKLRGKSGFLSTETGEQYQELVEDLSPREQEILVLIGRGLSNQEISRELKLSVKTVKWHNSNIFGKLGVTNRTRAVARARELALLP